MFLLLAILLSKNYNRALGTSGGARLQAGMHSWDAGSVQSIRVFVLREYNLQNPPLYSFKLINKVCRGREKPHRSCIFYHRSD